MKKEHVAPFFCHLLLLRGADQFSILLWLRCRGPLAMLASIAILVFPLGKRQILSIDPRIRVKLPPWPCIRVHI